MFEVKANKKISKLANLSITTLVVFSFVFSPFATAFADSKGGDDNGFPANSCSTDLYSDESEIVNGGGNAVGTYNGHPDWTAHIYNASWVWRTYQVENPEVEETVTFTRTFDLSSAPISSSFLTMAADNSYVAKVNGVGVAANSGEFNYKLENVILIPITNYLQAGTNTITFEVTNFARLNNTWDTNPAGLLYRVNITQVGPCVSPVPPTVTLTANPTSITAGQNSSLTWVSTNATSCSAPWTASNSVGGGQVVTPASTTVYSINCVGPYGSASATTTVTVTTGGGGGPTLPTVTLSANPSTIVNGATSTLSWTSTNASYCSAPWTTSTSTLGSRVVSPATTTSYSISCVNNDGSASATTTIIVQPASNPTPSITLSANPASIVNGNSSTLSWTSANTNFCSAAWTNATSTSGSQSVSPTSTTNYAISCGGQYGTTTATTTVTVTTGGGGGSPTPAITLTANPGSITNGSSSTLSWTSSNTSFCVAPWTSATSTSGSQSVSPSQTTDYGISCGGQYGTTTATTTVTVTTGGGGGSPTPSVSLSANPGTINSGGSSILSWNSSNTSFCNASWTSATSTSGSQTVNPTSTTDYGISCGGQYGTTTATTTVTVNTNNGGGGGGGGGDGGGGIGGGRRRDISNLLAPQGEVLGATSCSYLRDHLRRDWNNDPIEVLKLQSFLNVFENENLSLTTVFDESTYNAVERFQNKYFGDVLEPWGHEAPTGFVYILTKKKVNEIYCNTSITLTEAQQLEILTFRNFLVSLKSDSAIGGSSLDSSFSSLVGDNGQNATSSSENVLDDDNNTPVISLDADGTGGGSVSSVVKNAAVSMFGLSRDLFRDDIYLIVFAILLIVAGLAIKRLFVDSTPVEVSDNYEAVQSSTEDSPIVILPSSKSKKEQIYPDEEIVIENEEDK